MSRYLYFLFSHTIFVSFWIGLYCKSYYTYLNLVYIFGILALLDLILGKEKFSTAKNVINNNDKAYKYIIHSWSVIHLINVILTLCLVNTVQYSWFELVGIILSLGIEGGQCIAVAHELCHKNNKTDKWLSRLLLFTVMYNHFEIEHKFGHHVHVATELDPATAKYNQSYYRFWIQSVFGGFQNAFKIEKEKNGCSLKNKIIFFIVIYIIWLTLLFLINHTIFIFFITQSFIGFSFLEISNYFEHYGLTRKKLSNNTYESVKFYHSWDNDNCISNWILFRLGRHADHHTHPYKEYQYLVPSEESPQLITGYAGSSLLCLIPPLWFKLMNPKVDDLRNKYQ